MSELYKSFDVQKVTYEKEIVNLKKDFSESNKITEQKTKEIEILLKAQNNLLKAIETDKDEILHLKDEIRQYKSIIEDLTPLCIDHLFQGYITLENANRAFISKRKTNRKKYSLQKKSTI